MSTIPKYRIQIIAFKFEAQFSWLLTSLSGTVSAQTEKRRQNHPGNFHVGFSSFSSMFSAEWKYIYISKDTSLSTLLFLQLTQLLLYFAVAVQALSHVWLFVTPCTTAPQASLSSTISLSLLKLMSIESWFHPTISPSVTPFSSCLPLSQYQSLFQWVSSLHQVAKVLELQLQHQSFQWIFRVDFL